MSTSGGARVLAVATTDRNGNFVFHDDSDSVAYSLNWAGETEWKHYAFVRDAAQLKVYVNGSLKVEASSSGNVMAQPGLLYCGISADRAPGNTTGLHDGFTGNMDDFKIYEYALSEPEVAYLTGAAGSQVPVDSPADLYNDNLINFRDFALLASQWLQTW